MKIKRKWGIHSNFQLVIIFIVFAITGFIGICCKTFLEFINLDRSHLRRFLLVVWVTIYFESSYFLFIKFY